jgi:hypothetical protein
MENGKSVEKSITIDTERIVESLPRLQNPLEERISKTEIILYPTKTKKRTKNDADSDE